jgi:phosphopantetheine--protein transferase-like protein
MPILFRENISDHGVLGVWKITESVDELLSMIKFTDEDVITFKKFKVKSRQAHWLSYRLMIRQLMGDDCKCDFFYDEHGKLQFKEMDYSISVTHSGLYSGVIISKNHYVGIDIEKLDDRINLLADKFLSDYEKSHLPEINQHRYLAVLWSSKEAIFKLYGKSKVLFDKNIILDSFDLQVKGNLKGRIVLDNLQREYTLNYEFSDNDGYILVYCVDESMKIKTYKS